MHNSKIIKAKDGEQYEIAIRKYTPRDCFRLMGVRDQDIDKMMAKEKTGKPIIADSNLYKLAGNSIVADVLTAIFSELFFPSGQHYADHQGQLSLF